MRRATPPHRRALVIARPAEGPQSSAVVGTLGLISLLLLVWFGLH